MGHLTTIRLFARQFLTNPLDHRQLWQGCLQTSSGVKRYVLAKNTSNVGGQHARDVILENAGWAAEVCTADPRQIAQQCA
eukprot:12635213-Prorocentrum_lima.AAC.1